jgi:toxin ParE1/3/4
MLSVIFLPAAQAELIDAQDWYEVEVAGLGRRFRDAVDTAVTHIATNPQQFPTVFQDVRRALVRTFPYGLFFRIEPDAIYVIACFHGSRSPRQWRQRLG